MQLQSGRVAVVTGGASGIGLALARAAGAAGMHVLLSDVRDDVLEQAAEGLRTSGASVSTLAVDVSDPAAIEELAERAFAAGSVQLICSNAGIVVPGRAWEIPPEAWQRVIDVNLMATVHVLHAFFPRLLTAGEAAHLLVTGSMASVTARPGISPYVTAKHGLLGLCEALHHELAAAALPIGVTLLMPGQVITGMNNGDPPPTAISADEVARVALDAVGERRLFAFTQADRVPEVERRFTAIVAEQVPEAPG
jgi:NAD(P)-dependent dehydrogenase (short-subunit alcohol dehydrogenase family)